MTSKKTPPASGSLEALLPTIATAFSELGYRRATTAELAKRCGVRENVLYRRWPNKKAMFIAAIDHVFDNTRDIYQGVLDRGREGAASTSAYDRILAYEATHIGELGHYRILFTGLAEVDDPDIRRALRDVYRRFHEFVESLLEDEGVDASDADLVAWGVVGLGTISTIARELRLLGKDRRKELLLYVGSMLRGE